MSSYENPEIPEGINTSKEHPLKEFTFLIVAVTLLLVASVFCLSLLAGYLVRYIPFEQEQALVSGTQALWQDKSLTPEQLKKQQYLQTLTTQLAAQMNLPSNMPITVHYQPDDTNNALATLGGNIVVFQGLIDHMPNENALSMVLAHEIAHIQHRHPIVAMGRGFTVMVALTTLAGVGDGMMQQWLGSMGLLTAMSFNREQEAQSDQAALQALHKHYGHTRGAEAFFEYVLTQQSVLEPPALLSTHPGTEDRLKVIRQFQQQHGISANTALRPLPDYLRAK